MQALAALTVSAPLITLAGSRRAGSSSPRSHVEKILVIAVIIAFVGVLAWVLVKSQQMNKQREFDRKIQARKAGWMYHGTREGRVDYRFTGAARGIEWSMWYDSDRGDESPTPISYWQSANVRSAALSLVIIGRKRYQMESGTVGRLLMDVVGGLAQAVAGETKDGVRVDKSEFYESAVLLDKGRASFRERFAVAVSPEMPHGWLDDELQKLLLEWPKTLGGVAYRGDEKVEITLRQEGLKIAVQQMPQEFAFWDHLARLGQALAERLGGVAAR